MNRQAQSHSNYSSRQEEAVKPEAAATAVEVGRSVDDGMMPMYLRVCDGNCTEFCFPVVYICTHIMYIIVSDI